MKVVLFLLIFVSAVYADDSLIRPLNFTLNQARIVKIDCYLTTHLIETKKAEDINRYLNNNARLISIMDDNFLKEMNSIFKSRTFVKRRVFVLPRWRNYSVYALHFSDNSTLSLVASSSFSENQFHFVKLSGKKGKYKLKRIRYFSESDEQKLEVVLFLPDFQKSKFLRHIVSIRENMKE